MNLKDDKYNSPPLGCVIHVHQPSGGNQGRQREVAALLVAAGANVDAQWLESEQVRSDAVMLSVLRGGTA